MSPPGTMPRRACHLPRLLVIHLLRAPLSLLRIKHFTQAGTLVDILAMQVSSPSQAAARKQQHASSPSRIGLRQRRELEQANEQQRQDIMRSASWQLPLHGLGACAE